MKGPLSGIRVIEFAGMGPGPFAGMMLADHGADVIQIHRPDAPADRFDIMQRTRRIVHLDLKSPEGRQRLLALAEEADALIEVFRPGAMERLGLGPDVLHALNPRLVYARMTGWGQTGPRAMLAGHDINYIATSGALHATGVQDGPPVAPPALIGDLGGGGMLLAFAIVSAILHARASGQGQVIDCAMSDGAALLMTAFYGRLAEGAWRDARGVNLIDGGAPFYGVYETSDRQHVTIGPLEPQFYSELLARLGLQDDPDFADQFDQGGWSRMRARLEAIFAGRTRAEWTELLGDSNACFAPVLALAEAPDDPHNRARNTFLEVDGIVQPAPAPRYSATPLANPRAPAPLEPNARTWAPEAGITS